jgi:hypothetical protein
MAKALADALAVLGRVTRMGSGGRVALIQSGYIALAAAVPKFWIFTNFPRPFRANPLPAIEILILNQMD